MKRVAIWACVVLATGCGGAEKPSPTPSPAPGKSQPEPPKPRDETKEAVDSFPEFARKEVEKLSPIFVGKTVFLQIKLGQSFEYEISELKVRDTDVRKTDSLSTPIVGTIKLDVLLKLTKVTGFPKEFVPASAKDPVRRVDIECVRQGTAWTLKSSEDLSAAILAPPK